MSACKTEVMERIWARTMPIPECGCYVWMGGLTGAGYGQISISGKDAGVHRVAYELLVGPIPDGLDLDHLCRVRSCWRPEHLEPVTHRINILRGRTVTGANARKTHCLKGHFFTEANTYRTPDGKRQCRQCRRENNRNAGPGFENNRYFLQREEV